MTLDLPPGGDRPSLSIVSGRDITGILATRHRDVIDAVRSAYMAHYAGQSVNPDSYFLRFPQKPADRIIALPAYLGGAVDLAGIKWIASFPGNIERNRQRASAVMVLNDYATGYPVALLEASQISAHRTAASAALAARALANPAGRNGGIAVIGAGVIARTVLEYLHHDGWTPAWVRVHDLRGEDADRLCAETERLFGCQAASSASASLACQGADLIVLATTAATPHLTDPDLLAAHPTILNISLRDLSADLILCGQNILDDIDHCLKAQTSPHLAEMQSGGRGFVNGVLADVLTGKLVPDPDRARIFSPFGLGILDIALAKLVLDASITEGSALVIGSFFPDMDRW